MAMLRPPPQLFASILFLLALCALLPDCHSYGCDASFSPSIVVKVVDEKGVVDRHATVTGSTAGSPVETAMCQDPPGEEITFCNLWYLQSGPGTVLVKATSADGTKTAQESVDIERDGDCHVFGKSLTLTLR